MMTKTKRVLLFALLALLIVTPSLSEVRVYDVSHYGLKAGTKQNASPILRKLLARIRTECRSGDSIVLRFSSGTYHFHEEGAETRTYYISNHDQTNPKRVGMALEGFQRFTLDGQGAQFVFHGRMLPLSLLNSTDCTLRDFSIDFENPHIAQVKILKSDSLQGMLFQVAPWVKYRIDKDGFLETYGEGWTARPISGIAFEPGSKHLVYRTGDLGYSTQGVEELGTRTLRAPLWKDTRLTPGTVVAMRTYSRPAPGIFMAGNRNTLLQNIRIHYAEGMGLLAQLCENITLTSFRVCLKGEDDPRYFTTQADATHFSACKGRIVSTGGLYENMMDDAINVHGTYLKVVRRIDDHTLIGRYMHPQSWGFDWGQVGDSVQFIRSATMDLMGEKNRLVAIRPHDSESIQGVREFVLSFSEPIHPDINEREGFGVENLSWTPEVIFSDNIIRNNRARGTLFSTPRPVLVENNLFDHTSGTAILLCGDCNGWYETGACRRVVIRRNRFVNALTNLFQFTNAIISIYPEIPRLDAQQGFFHGGEEESILIEDNVFDTFDLPILYAKSVDGLVFRNNRIEVNTRYRPFHPNRSRFLLERTNRVRITE